MADQLSLWSHTLAALLFAAVALWAARAPAPPARWPLVATLALCAVWALAVAGLGGGDPATRLIVGLRDLSLLGLMIALHRGMRAPPLGITPVYGVVALVVVVGTMLQLVAAALGTTGAGAEIVTAATLLRMMAAVAALVLVHNLSMASGDVAVRGLGLALAGLWGADLALATSAYLSGSWAPAMLALRGLAGAGAAGLVALALRRGEHRPVAVSRMVAYQSLSLVAVGGYLALLALGTSALTAIGGEAARIYQTAFVFGSTAAVLTFVSSSWLRSWLKVKIAKHLFRHRYDYRAEWLRFTGTLGSPEAAAPLAERIVKAIADLTGSDRGLLLVPDGDMLGVGARWQWDGAGVAAGADFARYLGSSERIIALDDLRAGSGDAAELACTPQWMLDDRDVWAVVPMLHLGRLVGAVVLARPLVDRALDWEDFDLLKVAGRQVASYLAEARAQEALADGRRFDEFNRRFAFIVHDIKNLVSGLSLVARNAERHADNPDFRADMVATLQDSAAKLNMLLARLSANPRVRGDAPVAVPLLDFAQRLAAGRSDAPVIVSGDPAAVALADPAALDQIVGHLVANAVEASPPAEPVTIAVGGAGTQVSLSVTDCGCGMSPAFVRDRLFRPFVSSKPGGFGIGAFEARQLAEAMGGRILVESREGQGSTFRVLLPAAHAQPIGIAA
ncbi:XrtA/PEP-CTERM system histidine kinase PrsK [Sphingomonas sp.]|uniref:XrtA/PEP-CTERM system histidine kinase PrsK n=1 Tax=Sphingomonas sp. TaxID=28214 RepID=UPI002DD646AE|nr:XrtA/PEP-CTERM system histidine kinase PrsK [Sphingomonas sp.]